uniref:Uncharacterized protein n=1 Tax=Hucho hucho TaxID=62062 RepID=A0A4W5JRT9_9TELE
MFSPPVSGKNGPTSLGSGHFAGSSMSITTHLNNAIIVVDIAYVV